MHADMKQEFEALDASIENSKQKIEVMETLERLQKNPDFKALIEENYMKSFVLRQVELKATKGLAPAILEDIDKQLDAVSFLNRFFMAIVQQGRTAENDLHSAQEEHDLLIEEEV